MASVLGTSSAALWASRPLLSPSSKPAIPFPPSPSASHKVLCFATDSPSGWCRKKFYGRIVTPGRKGRSQFHFAVTNVATRINSVEQDLDVKESQRPVYPFSAMEGHDEMKLCLLLNVIDPKIGGVMIMGDRELANPLWLDHWLIYFSR
ncbi:hypothetical protein SLEP1_g44899 [Rubroshorea leprosula]|uniref:Uncharacterized protein n=1 Tax=Rubroshorea leprosula TaxID=152421 RepID=A0AAV5LJT3_9ROSI|nr:hypothetical protein SLEP1_g44899 [Rubroshorea leprosula]